MAESRSKRHNKQIKLLETMKKIILSIALLAALTVGNAHAQYGRAYQNKPRPVPHAQMDNRFEEIQINNLDKIVGLSRKQENKIKKIEDQYDRLMSGRRVSNMKELQWRKQQDIIEVLTPVQRQRLMAFQNGNRFDRYNRRG
jgi:Spy/CpxP family protein refolding chaperone